MRRNGRVAVRRGVRRRSPRLLAVVPSSRARRSARHPDLADLAVGARRRRVRVDDRHLVLVGAARPDATSTRRSSSDSVGATRSPCSRARRPTHSGGRLALRRPAGDEQRRLGESVAGQERLAAKPAHRERLGESLERVRAHRLGAVERRAPRRQVERGALRRRRCARRTGRRRSSARRSSSPDSATSPRASAAAAAGTSPAPSAPPGSPRRPAGGCRRSAPCRGTAAARTRRCRSAPVRATTRWITAELCSRLRVREHHAARVSGGARGVLQHRQLGARRDRTAHAAGVARRRDRRHRATPRRSVASPSASQPSRRVMQRIGARARRARRSRRRCATRADRRGADSADTPAPRRRRRRDSRRTRAT